MSRRVGWIVVALLALPVAVSLALLQLVLWAGLWGAANLAWGFAQQSPSALSRGFEGSSTALVTAGRVAQGWGWLLPGDSGPTAAGDDLVAAGRAAGAAAPVVPQLLGFDRTARYLVAALNDAELFGSGGAPLDLAVIEVDRGRPAVATSGSVGHFNPNNQAYAWPVIGGLPWYRPGATYPFANSNYHPDFPISGQNMVTAWNALGQPEVDGVITLDVSAVAAVLRAIGPVQTQGYGEVTADNVIRKVLVDAYRELPIEVPGALEERQKRNSELRSVLLSHMSNPLTALRVLAALWGTFPARHVQGFLVDPACQKVVVAAGADAALATAPGDVLGVFLQSGVSKLAVFQDRTISTDVQVAADGSAKVVETVRFVNDVPEGLPGDPTTNRGYLALIFRQRVAFRIPEQAGDPTIEVADARPLVRTGGTGPFTDSVGASVLWQGQDIPPGQSSTTTVRYTLPAGTFGADGDLTYHLTANPQAMVKPVSLEVTVHFAGTSARPTPGWDVEGDRATWRGTLDRTLSLSVAAQR